MKTWKRALALVLALVMALSLVALPSFADDDTCTVTIKYLYRKDNTVAKEPWVATVKNGDNLNGIKVTSPAVLGYTPSKAVHEFDATPITSNQTITVWYDPAEVQYKVIHHWQDVDSDNYSRQDVETKTGYTDALVGSSLAKTVDGFTALLYDENKTIAADGTTTVDIYYVRNYYLMNFDLNGGWGVEPIYARFGAAIPALGTPEKAGYTFAGWDPSEVPATMPAQDKTFTAQWKAVNSADVTVIVWGEKADSTGTSNENYAYVKSVKTSAAPGTKLTAVPSDVNLNMDSTLWDQVRVDEVTVAADGSSVLNVYFDRTKFTLTFYYNWTSGFLGAGAKYKTTDTITAKWGNQIGDRYLAMNKAAGGSLWSRDYSGDDPWTSFLQVMPTENRDYYCRNTSSTQQSAEYYAESLTGGYDKVFTVVAYYGRSLTITVEDLYPMKGFTYNHGFDGDGGAIGEFSDSVSYPWNGAKFYYTRNSYNVVFMNGSNTEATRPVKYEAALSTSNYETVTPSYPSNLPTGAYKFDGWYQDPEGSRPVDWTSKMPAEVVTVYAKWIPITHTVTFSKTENSDVENTQEVSHNSQASDPNITNAPYDFIGWFYKDENGVEHAFNLSMAVTRDLDLYGKWRANKIVPYTVKYIVQGTDTEIADRTSGSAPAGTSQFLTAKGGTDLYEKYQDGYFPVTRSHDLQLTIDGDNTYTFEYVEKVAVPYTVRYVDTDGNEINGYPPVVHKDNRKAIVTETAKAIPGYVVDQYQKTLVVLADGENVITFVYTKDDQHATVFVRHMLMDTNGAYTIEYSSKSYTGEIGQTYSEAPLTIDGFTYNAEMSTALGKLEKGTAVLELTLYYDRQMYPYTIKHVDYQTGNIIETETGNAYFESSVIARAKDFPDYRLMDDKDQKQIVITTGTNEVIFYYMPVFYVHHVQNGTEAVEKNTIDVTTSFDLTKYVPEGFLYGGSFKSDYTTVADFHDGNPMNFDPQKGDHYYIWEVSEDYLHPFYYRIWKPVEGGNGGEQTVSHLYMMAPLDRLLYSAAGFTLENGEDTVDYPVQRHDEEVAYGTVQVDRMGQFYQRVYVCEVNGQVKIESTRDQNFTDYKPGYIAFTEINAKDFDALIKDRKTIEYTPYWVTLDGVKVTSVDTKECSYTGGSTINTKNIPHKSEMTPNAGEATTLVAMSFVPVLTVGDTDKDQITVTIHENGDVRTVDVQPGDLTGELAYTEVAGKLFAGFFQDEACTVPADFSDVQEDITVYAKYVSDSYLQVKYTEKGLFRVTGVNLFSAVSSGRDFAEVGILVNDQPIDTRCASRYLIFQTARTMFGLRKSDQLVIGEYSLRNAESGTQLVVTPYWVTLDGTTVTGTQRTLTYTTRGIRG